MAEDIHLRQQQQQQQQKTSSLGSFFLKHFGADDGFDDGCDGGDSKEIKEK